jgi:hypothetical protein
MSYPAKKSFAQSIPADSAQATQQDEFLDLSLDALMNMKVTSGSFLDLDLKTSALSLTVINKDQIHLSGARHLTELLEIYTPGFQYMYNKWNGVIWGMRGVAADRNTKFIFLVNGHKMNTEARDGAIQEMDLGLLGDIQRVEIIRGPSGLIYGSGAIAGVVNIVTKKYQSDQIEVSTTQGAWGGENFNRQYEATVSQAINENANIVVSGGYRKSDGIGSERGRLYGRPHWPYPQWMSNPPADGVPVSGSPWSTPGNYRASVDLNIKKFRFYSRYTRQVTNASGWFPVDPWPDYTGVDTTAPDRMVDGVPRSIKGWYGQIEPYGTNRRQYIVNNITNQFSYTLPVKDNDVVLNAGFDANTNRIANEDLKGSSSSWPEERNTKIAETFGERRYNASAMYILKSVSKLQLAAGYQFRLFDIGNDMTGLNAQEEKATHPIVSDVIYKNHAFFTEGVYNIHKKLDAQFGLRYDIHTRTKNVGGVITPKIALVAKPSDNHSIKLIYQTSANNGSADNYEFNRNTIGDNGQPFEGSDYHYEKPFEKPGPGSNVIPPVTDEALHSLRPERSSSLELTSMHSVANNKIIIAPSLSYNTIKDLFTWNQKAFRIVNSGSYHFFNAEIDAKIDIKKVTIGANHVYSRVVNTTVSDHYEDFTSLVFSGYDSTDVGNGVYKYTPKKVLNSQGGDSISTVKVNPIRDQITVDGKNFVNLNTNISKIYVDAKLADWVTIHTDARIFWGLTGRKDVHQFDTTNITNPDLAEFKNDYANNKQYNYLGIHNKAMVKWNAGISINASEKLTVAIYAYDLLAGVNKRHTLRWQQSGNIKEHTDLFSVDYTSFALKVNYKFGI